MPKSKHRKTHKQKLQQRKKGVEDAKRTLERLGINARQALQSIREERAIEEMLLTQTQEEKVTLLGPGSGQDMSSNLNTIMIPS